MSGEAYPPDEDTTLSDRPPQPAHNGTSGSFSRDIDRHCGITGVPVPRPPKCCNDPLNSHRLWALAASSVSDESG
jgi:hypothetical protein